LLENVWVFKYLPNPSVTAVFFLQVPGPKDICRGNDVKDDNIL